MSDSESQVSSSSGAAEDSAERHSRPSSAPSSHAQPRSASADPARSDSGSSDSAANDGSGEGIRLRQLARLGELFAGFAHEIRNPLSTVGLNLQLIEEDLSGAGDSQELQRVRRRLGVVDGEVDRLQNILEQFLGYVRVPDLQLRPTDLNGMLADTVEFNVPKADERGVSIRFFGAPELPAVRLDPDQVKAVIVNLLNNALDACESGDEILLRTMLAGGDGVGGGDGAASILVIIADTGAGMDEDTRRHAFEPYFSTKRQGTGLGLPTARRTVEQHGGRLELDSEPGRGTQFTLRLPVDGPPASVVRGGRDTVAGSTESGT